MDVSFSAGKLISQGWELTKDHFGTYLKLGVMAFLIVMVPQMIQAALPEELGLLSVLISLVMVVVQIMISINMLRATIKLIDGEEVKVSILWEFESRKVVTTFVTQFVTGFLVVLGLICFIIPGIYLAIAFSQSMTLIADRGVGVKQAIRDSMTMTKGIKLRYLWVGLVFALLNLLGLLALIVGVVITMMITSFGMMLLYKILLKRLDGGEGVAQPAMAPAAAPEIPVTGKVSAPTESKA